MDRDSNLFLSSDCGDCNENRLKLDGWLSWYSRICLSEMDASSVELGLFFFSGRASWDLILDFIGRLIMVFTILLVLFLYSIYRTLQITSISSHQRVSSLPLLIILDALSFILIRILNHSCSIIQKITIFFPPWDRPCKSGPRTTPLSGGTSY